MSERVPMRYMYGQITLKQGPRTPRTYGRLRYRDGRIAYRNYKREIPGGLAWFDVIREVSERRRREIEREMMEMISRGH